jgi:hypothetical protein
MSECAEGHVCLLPFDTDDPQFARGFEAGRIWALLDADPDRAIDELVHGANGEMLLRMSEATGRAVRWEQLGDEWFQVRFDAVEGDRSEVG